MAKDGLITRKDIIEDQAMNIGSDYAKSMQPAIEANKQLVASLKEMAPLVNVFRNVGNQQAYIQAKQQENIITLQAINANKLLEASEISLEKIKKAKLLTEKAELDVASKKEAITKRNTQLTIEERVQNEVNNKALRQAAREQLGLVGAYEKLNKARTDAKNKLRDLISSESASTAEIKKAQKEYDVLNKKVRMADDAVDDFTKNVGNYPFAGLTSGLKNLISAFGVIGGITLFSNIVKDIFETTKELQSLDLALKSVTGTQEEFAKQQLFLQTISEKYGLELKNLTKQFIAFYVAAKDKVSGKEIQEIFENISKSGSALGLSNDTLERSFQAVNQMLSKGTVASEELRGQLAESMPGAVQAMTRAVQKLHPEIKNLTEKGLFQMIKDGKILASEVLPETSRQLVLLTGADKAQGIETLTKLTNRLTNDWTNMVRSINETDTSGFGIFVKRIVAGLSNILQFTGLLFKNESQLQDYFKNLGKQKGLEEYEAIMKNIGNTSKENQELTKKELLFRERENIRVNQAIVKSEKEKRASILGGDRALFHLQTKKEEDALFQIGKSSAIIKKIKTDEAGLQIKNEKAITTETDEERKKREAAERKARQDYLAKLKKFEDDAYALKKFRLDKTIELNQEVVDDEKKSLNDRLDSFVNVEKLKKQESELTFKHEMMQNALSKIDTETTSISQMESIKKAAESKANSLIKGVSISKDATNAEKLIYEKFIKEKEDLDRKSQESKQKIIDFEIDLMQKQIDKELLARDTKIQEALIKEENQFKTELQLAVENYALLEKAKKDHEDRLSKINSDAKKDQLNTEIDAIQKLLDAEKLRTDGSAISIDKIKKLENELTTYKKELLVEDNKNTSDNTTKRVELEKEAKDRIRDMQFELKDVLVDLANTIFDARIQNIDNEITASNEYYDKQIELAGNDERQKSLLEKERAKKEKELQKEKQKEQLKAAIFNKIMTVATIAMQTAMASASALAPPPIGLGPLLGPSLLPYIIGLGALQTAVVLATPLPKYKGGRKGGPAELAVTGDGGVPEVVSRSDGSGARMTPNKPTLTFLQKDDIVHKSVADYNEYMRRSILKGFYKEKEKSNTYQFSNNQSDNSELLKELKRNTDAINKQKTTVNVSNNVDIGYEIWRLGNINWR